MVKRTISLHFLFLETTLFEISYEILTKNNISQWYYLKSAVLLVVEMIIHTCLKQLHIQN